MAGVGPLTGEPRSGWNTWYLSGIEEAIRLRRASWRSDVEIKVEDRGNEDGKPRVEFYLVSKEVGTLCRANIGDFFQLSFAKRKCPFCGEGGVKRLSVEEKATFKIRNKDKFYRVFYVICTCCSTHFLATEMEVE